MHQILKGLVDLASFAGRNPAAMQITCSLITGAKRGYARLSPANKAKVDSLLIQAAEHLANAVLGDVLDWTMSQAISLGLNTEAAAVAEAGVRRIADVGISKTFEELRR